MTQYNSFNQKKRKLNYLFEVAHNLYNKIPELYKPQPKEYSVTYLKKHQTITLDTTPTYYDLYNWLGTTYTSGDVPEPADAYVQGDSGWYWRYPIEDFRVPSDSTPQSEVPGTTEEQWEYTRTVAIVNTNVYIKNLNEQLLNYTKLKSFLYNENDEDFAGADFSEISRWHTEPNGYTFYYNAYYSVEEDESQVLVKAELILTNPQNYDALYNAKLK